MRTFRTYLESAVMWTQQSGQAFLATLTPLLRFCGYTPSIVGSVSAAGKSDHDLDILLHPSGKDFDFDTISEYLKKQGWMYISKGSDYIETFKHPDGRVIDFFFEDT